MDGDDLYGDGVNLAARLQEIADTGGVCLSDGAFQQVRGKVQTEFTDGGEVSLKNIKGSVQVWHWSPAETSSAAAEEAISDNALPLPDKPSIAVLPFDNMSGDPEQDYFADGIAEDIITTLSRFKQFKVIARNSTFAYKGRNVDTVTVKVVAIHDYVA